MPMTRALSRRVPTRNVFSASRTLAGIVLVTMALPANAATIAVTTTRDVIAIDGECSLREAVTAANANVAFNDCRQGEPPPTVDVVELPPGIYSLTREPAGEDGNLGGDLDITEAVTIRGLGDDFIWWDDPETPEVETLDVYNDPDGYPRSFTEADLPGVVIENGLGEVETLGDGDRVIHTLPPADDDDRRLDGMPRRFRSSSTDRSEKRMTLPIRFENLAIARGDDACSGELCSDAAAGVFHTIDASLILDSVALFDNRTGCLGFNCGSDDNAAAVRISRNQELQLLKSVVAANRATCADTQCRAGRIIEASNSVSALMFPTEINQTLVVGNVLSCSAGDCRVAELMDLHVSALRLEQTVITDNEIGCSAAGFQCETEPLVEVSNIGGCGELDCAMDILDVEISANRLTCDGYRCDVDQVLNEHLSYVAQSIQRLRFRDNEQSCFGMSCHIDPLFSLDADNDEPAATLALDELEALDNTNRCEGDGCNSGGVYDGNGHGLATLSNFVARNESACVGDSCSVPPAFFLNDFALIAGVSISDSELSCSGTGCLMNPLVKLDFEDPLDPVVDGLEISNSQAVCDGVNCGFGGSLSPTYLGEGGLLRLSVDDDPAVHLMAEGVVLTDNTTNVRGVLALDGSVELIQSSLTGNMSFEGGAIYNGSSRLSSPPPGFLTLRDTTITGNEAIVNGGGIYNAPTSTLRLIDSATSGNLAVDGGGIFNEGSIRQRQGTSIDGNTPNQCVDSGAGTGCSLFFSDGFESGNTMAWSQVVQ